MNPAEHIPNDIVSRITTFQNGIGPKYTDLIVVISAVIGSVCAGFYINVRIMGVLLGVCPLTIWAGYLLQNQTSKGTSKKLYHYAKSGTVASEIFRNIRTVAALTSETIEIDRYQKSLVAAEASTIMVPTYQPKTLKLPVLFV